MIPSGSSTPALPYTFLPYGYQFGDSVDGSYVRPPPRFGPASLWRSWSPLVLSSQSWIAVQCAPRRRPPLCISYRRLRRQREWRPGAEAASWSSWSSILFPAVRPPLKRRATAPNVFFVSWIHATVLRLYRFYTDLSFFLILRSALSCSGSLLLVKETFVS